MNFQSGKLDKSCYPYNLQYKELQKCSKYRYQSIIIKVIAQIVYHINFPVYKVTCQYFDFISWSKHMCVLSTILETKRMKKLFIP